MGTSRSLCCPQNLSSPNLLRRQGPHESIYISSDDEDTFDADEGASSNGYQDIDDSRSDDTLTTVDAIIASIKKSSPVFSPIWFLYDNDDQPQILDSGAGRSSQGAATGPDTTLSCTSTSDHSHRLQSDMAFGFDAL
ncbi:unnamed protein product [Clonostachys rosea f. rosea IK726]|uniref:Uncharacterized protein n=1 Tax=Clonostachys rosea f. rosea IK726 TaxID=1349383 RepID=A0ACA9U629_BIOOC|nr:unnamed protein product [Clonostachys rosea f. rosea IK726]